MKHPNQTWMIGGTSILRTSTCRCNPCCIRILRWFLDWHIPLESEIFSWYLPSGKHTWLACRSSFSLIFPAINPCVIDFPSYKPPFIDDFPSYKPPFIDDFTSYKLPFIDDFTSYKPPFTEDFSSHFLYDFYDFPIVYRGNDRISG